MKIIDLKVHILKSEIDQPFAFSQGWVHSRSATLVEIITDTGLTGWGEAFAQGLEPPEIAASAIEFALKPLVIDADPLDTEVLWHRMYHMTRDYGRKGTLIAAISAVDIALWDLAGQHLELPVSQLLGGRFRNSVQPYATGFYRIEGQGESKRLVEEALGHHKSGFKLMKIKLGYGVDDDIEVMEQIGGALAGKGVKMMVDTNHAYGRNDALRLGRELEQYDLHWYEEPVVPEDLEGYRELRAKLDMPIAGGENEHTLYGFKALLAASAVDIAQPDVGSCGGITAMRHITALAQSHGVKVNPHVWGSAVAQAASLQVLASLPTTNHRVFSDDPLLEFDLSSHPFRRELLEKPVELNADGMVDIPQTPGLGIDINRDIVEQYRCN